MNQPVLMNLNLKNRRRDMKLWKINMYYWIVRNLIPKRLIYFCYMHVAAHATTGKYGDTEVPALSMMDAINRYGKDFKIE